MRRDEDRDRSRGRDQVRDRIQGQDQDEDRSHGRSQRPSLSRRRLLQAGSIVGIGLLSGCTEDIGQEFPPNRKWPTAELTPSLPVEERTDVLEERIEAMADAEITDEDEFAAAFDGYELAVESVERERDVLTIEYVNTELHDEGNLHHVAPVAGGYAALIESGYDAEALEITVLDEAPASFGSATVETTWVERYNAGDLTAAEYGELVASTIESSRYSPEVEVSPDG